MIRSQDISLSLLLLVFDLSLNYLEFYIKTNNKFRYVVWNMHLGVALVYNLCNWDAPLQLLDLPTCQKIIKEICSSHVLFPCTPVYKMIIMPFFFIISILKASMLLCSKAMVFNFVYTIASCLPLLLYPGVCGWMW